jgi:hypothetical protein
VYLNTKHFIKKSRKKGLDKDENDLKKMGVRERLEKTANIRDGWKFIMKALHGP